ncbi:hypothetical protein LZ198_12420 [Myxococcus sp. K15C18031901]|uniref:hypothetical protein n=1 Tax=Myxococcus dinghuensis TaxID=2906761 RepID=UPI0020A7BB83|nr:hypothetical protein [Myxococcus dinghuensis]MCP3099673.1 hypothetical protein [Myxococcus dinghuensis]
MLKLYKKEGGSLRYWEAWVHERVLTLHWGTVGEVGEQKELPIPPEEEDPELALAEAAGPLVDDGYDEPDPDAMDTLIVQYDVEGPGSGHDLEKRVAVEELLTDALGWTGNGEVEGGEQGDGHLRVHCRVMDADAAVRAVELALDSEDLIDGATVWVARGDEAPRRVWSAPKPQG